jgi:hypothetical protein
LPSGVAHDLLWCMDPTENTSGGASVNTEEDEDLANEVERMRAALEILLTAAEAGLAILEDRGKHGARIALAGACDTLRAVRGMLDKL